MTRILENNLNLTGILIMQFEFTLKNSKASITQML